MSASINISGTTFTGSVKIVCQNTRSGPSTSITVGQSTTTHTEPTELKTNAVGQIILCERCGIAESRFSQPCSSFSYSGYAQCTDPHGKKVIVREDGVYDVIDRGDAHWTAIFKGCHQHK